jgi:hypothetical protein
VLWPAFGLPAPHINAITDDLPNASLIPEGIAFRRRYPFLVEPFCDLPQRATCDAFIVDNRDDFPANLGRYELLSVLLAFDSESPRWSVSDCTISPDARNRSFHLLA